MRKAPISVSVDRAGAERSFSVHGARVAAPPLAPGLYVVATPIGNLADVTLRALSILAAADAILAEDTRVSRTLLSRYGIETPLSPYHEHNAAQARPRAIRRIAEGQALALISDAGTPLSQIPAISWSARRSPPASPSPRPPAPRRRWRPSASPACRPTVSFSRASCRRKARRGANASMRWPASPAPSSFMKPRAGSPKRWRTSSSNSGPARRRWRAN